MTPPVEVIGARTRQERERQQPFAGRPPLAATRS
jgi:hypothetical protein